MHRALIPLAVLLLALPSRGYEPASGISVGETPPRIEIVASDEASVVLEFELVEWRTESVLVDAEECQRVSIPGGALVGEVGEPAIPVYRRLLAVPHGASVEVAASSLEEVELRGCRLVATPAEEGRESDPARGASRPVDPPALVEVGEPAALRDLEVVDLTFRPARYDADREVLTVARRMRVTVDFVDGPAGRAEAPSACPVPPSFDRLYRENVTGYGSLVPARSVAPGTYLVICPDDTTVTDLLQPLLEWRTRQGTPARLATLAETGATNAEIKDYIQGVYDDPAATLEYVVLVGDATGTYALPTWYETVSGYHGEGDLPYSLLAGDDVLPDVHLGRLSVPNPETLGYVVDKILGYERSPDLSEPDWFTRSCIVGDPYPSGMSCVESGRWLALRLAEIGHTEADTIFAEPWVGQMRASLDRGDTVFGYRGIAGMSGWSNAYTYLMTNGWKMPFCVVLTCETGSFASGTSVTEGFLRAWDTSLSQPRGGIGAIGLATPGTHTRYNNCLYFGIFRGFTTEGQHRMGAALTRGCLEMYLNYNSSEPVTVETWCHWANLMGDPALDVWTAQPRAMGVAHPAQLPVGANSFTAVVTDGPDAVDGARVCIWKGTEAYAVGATDALGRVELPITAATAGEVLLTVTGHDRVPYLATIPVGTESLYVGYAAAVIDDDSGGESAGNGDGVINPGETIELAVQLENFGIQPAAAVEATLTCADPHVSVTDAQESFGSIAGGAAAWSLDDFDFTVDGGCPHGQVIVLGLDITSGADAWHSRIELAVTSAELSVTGTTVLDPADSRLDPGDTVDVSVTLHNGGGAAATGTTGTLLSLSSFVAVVDSIGAFGTLGVGGAGENTTDRFRVSADPATYGGYLAHFLLISSFSGGALDTSHVSLTVGQRAATDPIGPDGRGYVAYDDTDTGHPEAPVYAWVELDPGYGGDGELIPFGDTEKYEDESVVVDLPFPFTYYGTTFSQATICTNGWLTMGATPLTGYRNWAIPAAGGPNGQLAVFWDDLFQDAGSRVLRKYDEANHRWIVEWSRMLNDYDGSSLATFEAILYDPAYYPTDSGDGIIVYQYETVNNVDPVNGYATAGIESPDQSDGLLYTYWNQYPAGAAPLAAGRAIRFQPTIDGPSGTLSGQAVNASAGGAPLLRALVEVVGAGRLFITGADGTYSGRMPPGTYTAAASFAGLVPDTVFAVTIQENAVTVVDFGLTDIAPPVITATTAAWTEDVGGPYAVPVTIIEGSTLVESSLYYRAGGSGFTQLPLQPQGGNQYLAEIPGQPFGTAVSYYVRARDELGYESTDPPGAPGTTYSFAVTPRVTLFEDAFETDQGWTIGDIDDNATEGIWVREEPVGTWNFFGEPVQPELDHTPGAGQVCFVTGNGSTEADSSDVDGGKTTVLSPLFDLSECVTVSVSYWVWFSNHRGNNPFQDPWAVKVTANGTDWVNLERTTDNTGEAWAQRTFVLEDYVELTDQVQIRFQVRDKFPDSLLEAALDDFLLTALLDVFTGVGPEIPAAVAETRLGPCRPNPFTDQTRMSFALARGAPVKLRVYDVSGRLVRTLVDGRVDAGVHEARWDGHNAAGRAVASGVYFVRLRTPESSQVRRMLLLR